VLGRDARPHGAASRYRRPSLILVRFIDGNPENGIQSGESTPEGKRSVSTLLLRQVSLVPRRDCPDLGRASDLTQVSAE
jgi:hypothetical protein